MLKQLFTEEIEDRYIRENFVRLNSFADSDSLQKGQFKHFDEFFDASSYPATITFRHRLGFTPKDLILTRQIGPGSVTFNYEDFDSTVISLTITDSVSLRFFLGAYAEGNIR